MLSQTFALQLPPPTSRQLVVAQDFSWVASRSGQCTWLNPPCRAILALLVKNHGRTRTAADVAQLVASGWPEDRPLASAGANRVYVAVCRLRTLIGDRSAIQRIPRKGYWLAPDVEVIVADSISIADPQTREVRETS